MQVTITKESCTIVGDGSTAQDVEARVKQIRNLAAETEQVREGGRHTGYWSNRLWLHTPCYWNRA
jgi:hypothetical protein